MVGVDFDNLFILYGTPIDADCSLYGFFNSLNVLLSIIVDIT